MSKENKNYDKEIARSICRLYNTVKKIVDYEEESKRDTMFDEFSKRRNLILTTQEEDLLVDLLEGVDEKINK